MKTIKIIAFLTLIVPVFLISCNKQGKADEAETTEKQNVDSLGGNEISIDSSTSLITFIGYGVGKNHPGNFKIENGKVLISEGQLTGGDFTINVNSLTVTQPEDMFQNKLKPHILSPDFLDAAKYPNAKFEITSSIPFTATSKDSSIVEGANFMVSGNLTLKDSTKNISFPAKIELVNNSFSAEANFSIDRRKWGISYGNDKSLKDKFISETIIIKLNLKSK